MRLGMGERYAGREHQGREIAPVGAPEILDRNARRGGRLDRFGIVVEGRDPRPAGDQRRRGDAAAAAQPEDGDPFAGKRRDGDHQRIFKLDRPRSASMTAMIQKRITICGSVQPRCSK